MLFLSLLRQYVRDGYAFNLHMVLKVDLISFMSPQRCNFPENKLTHTYKVHHHIFYEVIGNRNIIYVSILITVKVNLDPDLTPAIVSWQI